MVRAYVLLCVGVITGDMTHLTMCFIDTVFCVPILGNRVLCAMGRAEYSVLNFIKDFVT